MARSTAGMHFTIFSSIFIVSVYSLRYMISREQFPCLLYSFMFFMMPASFTVPNTLRSLRVYTQWRVNWFKAQNFKENEMRKNELDENCKEMNGGGEGELIGSGVVCRTPSSPILTGSLTFPNRILETNQDKWTEFKQYLDLHNKIEEKENIYRKANLIFHSKKWKTFIFVCVYGIQSLIWFSLAAVEESFFSETMIFMQEASMISLKGCYTKPPINIVIIILFVFYFIIEVVAFIWLLRTEKDTYFIKGETIITIIVQITAAIIYICCTMDFFKVYDRVFPTGLIMIYYCGAEIFITITLPVLYAIVKDLRTIEVFSNELEFILNKNETCEILLEYSRRSFCPEGVLVYKDITKFKQARCFKKRKLIALDIVKCYLTSSGVYELNLPNMNVIREDILLKINSAMCNDELTDDLFEEVQFQALLTLQDVLERLRYANEKIRKVLQEWKEKDNIPVSSRSPPTARVK
ncbi:predicted protein [Naegleria gruberi]|uniref:Predicted protein n=1 Tax=Naegleria gruberi TaxID=5762 RepID=D2VAW5_NAEGR|nr:uncharacterized protein NAEGRDRAFT_48059 [Naegleria gruberi]EFC46152.1 predicted protein [Naegleria gruberi]|eukprot:XP_002678896.1 predicted protein [Naegleria gruberi strain NEG-M]